MLFTESIKQIIKDCVSKLNAKNSDDFWIQSITCKDSKGYWKKTEYNKNGEIVDFNCSVPTPEIPNIF